MHAQARLLLTALLLLLGAALNACADDAAVTPQPYDDPADASPDAPPDDDAPHDPDAPPHDPDAPPDPPPRDTLPTRHVADPERAERGAATLLALDGPRLPWLALRSLWVAWGRTRSPSDADYWAEFAERYGFAPRGGDTPPWGVERRGDEGTLQCLACHADLVNGQPLVGAGNSRLRLEDLYDDLLLLAQRAAALGIPVPDLPAIWAEAFAGRTAGPGANDAFGMALTLASTFTPLDLETRYGFQQAPAWWLLPYKDRLYTDGIGAHDNHRTMLATALASGASPDDLRDLDADLQDLRHHLLTLTPPPWPFAPPPPERVAQGRAIFHETCASCHGTYAPARDGAFPDAIEDVDTDPLRHTRFTEREANALSASWFGQPPLQDTQGYLAPPLLGVWATAPYLHNGSVPDLRSLLRPDERPTRWRHHPTTPYDPERVGIALAPPDASSRTYDTTRDGLSAEGHRFGEDLTEDQLAALLAFLTQL